MTFFSFLSPYLKPNPTKLAYFNNTIKSKQKLILFIVPETVDGISGGMLSICSIYREVKALSEVHGASVFACFQPKVKTKSFRYTQFQNELIIYNFSEIKKQFKSLETIEIHLPEYMTTYFKPESSNYRKIMPWLAKISVKKINILNQNDVLMPAESDWKTLTHLCSHISMTVAHESYATPEKRAFYGIPMHLISPWVTPTPYVVKLLAEKENIIVLSPDEIDSVPGRGHLTRKEITDKLKKELPEYEFITIQNLRYDDYKNLIARAKYAITFGEGLDGYFIEPVLSGSVSFAVYNPFFFKEQLKTLPTLYNDFQTMVDELPNRIRELDQNPNEYIGIQQKVFQELNPIYSLDRLQRTLKNYYSGNLDLP